MKILILNPNLSDNNVYRNELHLALVILMYLLAIVCMYCNLTGVALSFGTATEIKIHIIYGNGSQFYSETTKKSNELLEL